MGTIAYRQGYKYQLVEDVSVEVVQDFPDIDHDFFFVETLGKARLLWIRRGYAWDGASGPAIDTETFLFPSLVHDVICQATDEGLVSWQWRKYGDGLLKDLLAQNIQARANTRVGKIWAKMRSGWVWRAVRAYSAWREKRKGPKPVLSALAEGAY